RYGGKTADEVLMKREDGKRCWAAILKRPELPPEVFVFAGQGDGDRRALSLAYGVCDALGLPRDRTIFKAGDPDWKAKGEDQPPNRHVYGLARHTRHLVPGAVIGGPPLPEHGWQPAPAGHNLLLGRPTRR